MAPPPPRYQLIRPLSQAADSFIAQVQDEDRFYLNLSPVDMRTRGARRGELWYITGFAQSGKSQLVFHALHHNSDKHIIVYTPDESPEIVLAKLVAMRHGVSAEALEHRVKVNDPDAIKLVQHAASSDFRRLLVLNAGLTLEQMGHALDEAEDYWQAQCDCAVYDYLELLPGSGSDFASVASKSQAMKRWTREANVPMLCIHQGKRGDGKRGISQGMEGMRYGGEQEAIVVLEVYRKRDNKALTEFERMGHQDTVTVNVVKNKRPPGKLGETDLHMDQETGRIRVATAVDLVRGGMPTKSAAEMLAASRKDDSDG